MSTQKNLITLCIATVFTLGLAACGGGGGGGAPPPGMVPLEGKYILSGTTIRGVDAPNSTTQTAANGVEVIPGVGTVECASEGGCSGTVEDGVVTITGDLKIVSVDPDLDSDTVILLARLAVDMLPVVPAPDPPTPAEQLETAAAAVEEAQEAVGALTSSSTPQEIGAAYTALAQANVALMTAKNLPANQIAALQDDIDKLQGQIDDLTADLGDADTAAKNLRAANKAVNIATGAASGLGTDAEQADIDAAGDLATAAQTAVDALDETDKALFGARLSFINTNVMAAQSRLHNKAMVAATTKAAGTKEKEIEKEAAGDGKTGLGGAAEYVLEIKRPRTGTEIKITDNSLSGDDDPKFMQTMHLGGGRTMHIRTMKADDDGNVVEEVVVVSTDIEAPKATAFDKVKGQALNADADGKKAGADKAVVFYPGDGDELKAADKVKLGNIKSADFAAAVGTIVTHTFAHYVKDSDKLTEGDQTIEAFETVGTYNGAMGTYKCIGDTNCTVMVNNKGMLTAASKGWIFTPDEGATSDVPDADYLHYGFWLKKTTDKDGVLTYNEVQTFAGSEVDASNDVNNVAGSASYEGGATGVYVHSVTDPDGTRASATSGHFTADAELEATFGQVKDENGKDSIAANLLNTVTGTIDNFALSGGEENGWSVNLKGDIDIADKGTGTVTSPMGATGGGDPGKWNATFHGPTPNTKAPDDLDATVAPGSVVGEFNANFSNGSVAGAFGARKQ